MRNSSLRVALAAGVVLLFAASPAYSRYYRRGYSYGNPAAQMMNGYANIIRAQAQANLTNQQARAKMIENKKRWVEVYYDRKRNHDAYMSEHTRMAHDSLITYLESRPSGAPRQLSFSEFDPATGQITWPDALQAGEFAQHRKELEDLFSLRAHTSATTQIAQHIRTTMAEMRGELQKHIDDMPPNAYIPARKFLDSLAYEGSRLREG